MWGTMKYWNLEHLIWESIRLAGRSEKKSKGGQFLQAGELRETS